MGLRKVLRKRYYFLLIKIAIHTPDLVEAKKGALLFAKTPTIHIYIQASDIYEQRHTSKKCYCPPVFSECPAESETWRTFRPV